MSSSNLTHYREWTTLYYNTGYGSGTGTITLSHYIEEYNEILVITGRNLSFQSGIIPTSIITARGSFRLRMVEYDQRYTDAIFTSGSLSVEVAMGSETTSGVYAIYGR